MNGKMLLKAKRAVRGFVKRQRIIKVTKSKGTSAQHRSAVAFFKPYCRINTAYHDFFYDKTGAWDDRYIPEDLWQNYIDRYYNDGKKAVVLENKCYFPKMFQGIKQPETVCYRLNGFWYTADDNRIGREEISKLFNDGEFVIKQAIGSSGGHAVFFVRSAEDAMQTIAKIRNDIIVQRPVQQHPVMSSLNSHSVNTIRLYSFLEESGVSILSTILRVGVGESRVDNASSGGLTCGVDAQGHVKEFGFTRTGNKVPEHPTTHTRFASVQIPHFDEAVAMVKRAHPMVPHFRIVAWDVMIDQDGEPVLIEANLNYSGIRAAQMENGPLFGDRTEEVLQEVFGRK